MDWINFYSVAALLFLIGMGVFLYYVYGAMAYQNAAAPWPPTGPAPAPDGWTLDAAGWAIIPAANLACTAAPSNGATPAPNTSSWQTVGSAPSAWKSSGAAAPCSFNVGLLHKVDSAAAYDAIAAMVPAAHKASDTDPSGFTTTGIVSGDYRAGRVSIDFSIDPSAKDAKTEAEKRRKFCVTYGVLWDGVADPDEVRATLDKNNAA